MLSVSRFGDVTPLKIIITEKSKILFARADKTGVSQAIVVPFGFRRLLLLLGTVPWGIEGCGEQSGDSRGSCDCSVLYRAFTVAPVS